MSERLRDQDDDEDEERGTDEDKESEPHGNTDIAHQLRRFPSRRRVSTTSGGAQHTLFRRARGGGEVLVELLRALTLRVVSHALPHGQFRLGQGLAQAGGV